jgi:hypothetical protein
VLHSLIRKHHQSNRKTTFNKNEQPSDKPTSHKSESILHSCLQSKESLSWQKKLRLTQYIGIVLLVNVKQERIEESYSILYLHCSQKLSHPTEFLIKNKCLNDLCDFQKRVVCLPKTRCREWRHLHRKRLSDLTLFDQESRVGTIRARKSRWGSPSSTCRQRKMSAVQWSQPPMQHAYQGRPATNSVLGWSCLPREEIPVFQTRRC